MKKKLYCGICVFLTLFFSLPEKAEGQNKRYFCWRNNAIGIMENNIINIYRNGGYGMWEKLPGLHFTLPQEYKNFWGISGIDVLDSESIAVQVNNIINFYTLVYNGRESAAVESSINFNLPDGFKNLIGTLDSFLAMNVNDIVKFYQYEAIWTEVPVLDFILPSGYRDVIILGNGTIAVNLNDVVKFFQYDGEGTWTGIPDLDFILPSGYKDIFVFDHIRIGVNIKDVIKIYQYNDKWEEISSAVFTINTTNKMQ
jgi:hypothetical protein